MSGEHEMVTLNFFTEMEFDEARERYPSLAGSTYGRYVEAVELVADALERGRGGVWVNQLDCERLEAWAELVGCEVDSAAARAACPVGELLEYEGEGTLWALSNADTAARLAGWCGESDGVDYDVVVEEAARVWNPLTARIEQLTTRGAVLGFATMVGGDQGWAVEIPLAVQGGSIVVPTEAHMRALLNLIILGYLNGANLVLHCFDDESSDQAARVYGWELGERGFVGLGGESVRMKCEQTVGWGSWDEGAVFLEDGSS